MNTPLRLLLVAAAGFLVPAATLSAQQGPTRADAGPRLERTAAALRGSEQPAASVAAPQARTNSVGKPVALMAVGGAAIVLGALIGNDIGTIFSIGGAVALLYGLYLYLR